jgi:trigger factor
VRLGLLLSEIGAANSIEVSEQEMRNLIAQAASQYQGKDRERFLQLVQQEPMFAAQLRAPLYEDKVVDFLFDKSEITDRKASRKQLEADLESEEGHVHGPGCGHEHSAAPVKAKTKKSAAKKAESTVESKTKQSTRAKEKTGAKKADVAPIKAQPTSGKPEKGEPAGKAAAEASAKKPAAKEGGKTQSKSAPKPKKPAKKG